MAAITHTLTVGPTGFDKASFTVPKFDTSLGTLTSVDIAGQVHDVTAYGVEFLCTAPGETTGRSSTTFTNHSYTELTFAGTTYGAGSGGENRKVSAASLYDGVTDLAGTSGSVAASSYDYDLVVPSVTGQAALDLTADGAWSILLALRKTAFYGQSDGACGLTLNFAAVSTNSYTYTLTVTYNYQ